MNNLERPLNSNERYLYEINVRLNILIEQMSSFLESYAEQNKVAVTNEEVEEYEESNIEDMDYEDFTVLELKGMLNDLGIKYTSNMRKSELIDLLKE